MIIEHTLNVMSFSVSPSSFFIYYLMYVEVSYTLCIFFEFKAKLLPLLGVWYALLASGLIGV